MKNQVNQLSHKGTHQTGNIYTGYTTNNKVKLIRGGREYFDLALKLIHSACKTIHLQTYIYSDDETGRMIGEALKQAAKRKVEVFLMLDGYASQSISTHFIDELKAAGVHFRFFEPLFKSKNFYFGRRMHHKVLVTDSWFALTGGSNIADRYNDMPEEPAWFDLTLFVEGETARGLCILCSQTWNGFPARTKLLTCENNPVAFQLSGEDACEVRIRRNDWVKRKNEISATYIEMLLHAKSHVTILCSYFLPGRVISRLLKNAAARGVEIRVITAGKSDIIMAKHAERWLYDLLLRNNIKILEYQPAVLHAKVAACDNEWLTVGSYNVNDISAYASIELNLDVRNRPFATAIEKELEKIIQEDCIPITRELHLSKKNIFIQFIRWCSYQSIRLIFHLATFYFKRIDRPKNSPADQNHRRT